MAQFALCSCWLCLSSTFSVGLERTARAPGYPAELSMFSQGPGICPIKTGIKRHVLTVEGCVVACGMPLRGSDRNSGRLLLLLVCLQILRHIQADEVAARR